MSLLRRILIYAAVLAVIGGVAAYAVITDFASTPYPPDLTLAEFDPVTPAPFRETRVWKPRFPVIEIHSHPQQAGKGVDELIKVMDEAGIEKVIDLDGNWGWRGERSQRVLEQYNLKYPDRFIMFVTLDIFDLGQPGYIEKERKKLEQAVAKGMRGIKIYKQFGTAWRDSDGKLIAIDDPRLDPVWEKIGELGIPVLMHTANPAGFWQATDRINERYEELYAGGSWLESYHDRPEVPSFDTLLQQRSNLMRRHRNVIFIGAHMAALGNDLARLGREIDAHPNFHVEISDRTYELGRQPYTARAFFIKYQDRLLFGTDLYPEAEVYRLYYRFLETRDEYFDYPRHYFKHGRWKIYGLDLPDDVLKKLYYDNAATLLGLKRG